MGGQAASPYVGNLFLFLYYSVPETLYLCEEDDHKSQMFVDSFLEGCLIGQSKSNIFGLHFKTFVFRQQSLYLVAEDVVLDKERGTF